MHWVNSSLGFIETVHQLSLTLFLVPGSSVLPARDRLGQGGHDPVPAVVYGPWRVHPQNIPRVDPHYWQGSTWLMLCMALDEYIRKTFHEWTLTIDKVIPGLCCNMNYVGSFYIFHVFYYSSAITILIVCLHLFLCYKMYFFPRFVISCTQFSSITLGVFVSIFLVLKRFRFYCFLLL